MRAAATFPLAAVVLGLTAATAVAALPPYWQSAREISAIIDDPRVHDALAYEEPIVSITRDAQDVYVLRTARCSVTVTIIDKPDAKPIAGPRQFDLQVGDAQCE